MSREGASIKKSEKRKNMTKSIIILTIFFIIFTVPYALITGYFIKQAGIIILVISVMLNSLYYSLTFFIFLVFNKQFYKEYKSMIGELLSNKKMTRVTPLTESLEFTRRTKIAFQ